MVRFMRYVHNAHQWVKSYHRAPCRCSLMRTVNLNCAFLTIKRGGGLFGNILGWRLSGSGDMSSNAHFSEGVKFY